MTSYLVNPKKAAEEKKATTPAAAKITTPAKTTGSSYTYTAPVLVEEDQKQFQQQNNNALAQAEAAAQRQAAQRQAEAQRQAAAQAEAQAEAQRQAQITAQAQALAKKRQEEAIAEAQRQAQAKAQQEALAAEIQRQKELAAQQRAQAEAKKLEQINTTPAAAKRTPLASPLASESAVVQQKTTTPAAYYWRGTNANNIDYKYTNPVAGTITPAVKQDDESAIILPGANAVRNITDKVRDVAGTMFSNNPQLVYRYNVNMPNVNPITPGLSRVENVSIPNMPVSTRVPLASPLAPAVIQKISTPQQSNADRLMNIAANAGTPTRDFMMGTKSYAERAALEKQLNAVAAKANVATGTETPAQSINRPAGSVILKSSYGQGVPVVKAPYKQGGYTNAELLAMGNKPRKDQIYYGNKPTYEGYYLAPDGNYYPVDQGKANYALSRGMTDPSQYWLYEGYTPDKEAYRNVMGTYSGYTPSWRTTVYANSSGAGKGGTWNYYPSGSNSAYGSGYSGELTGQQRYFNPVVNWTV